MRQASLFITSLAALSSMTGCHAGCHRDGDCGNNEVCVAPGHSPPVSQCIAPPPCQSDADCEAGSNCALAESDCTRLGLGCRPPCMADADCAEGTVCTNQHCVGRPCMTASDCPSGLGCVAGACARLACAADGDCPGGACVNGACYSSLGTCDVALP